MLEINQIGILNLMLNVYDHIFKEKVYCLFLVDFHLFTLTPWTHAFCQTISVPSA